LDCTILIVATHRAQVFVDKLTEDSNSFTPRVQVKEWIQAGVIMAVLAAAAAVLLGIVGAVERNKRVLVVFVGKGS
jgi:hypothetical protein